jgi:patatin-like phospholipase/acyl hydrolase
MAHYHVLSLDGGGIRGVLTATLLERLEAARPGFLDKIDLFAGTSTGGILALGLAAGLTPAQCRQLYEVRGEYIFSNPLARTIADLGNVVGAKYDNANLKKALTDQFGDKTLDHLPHRVLISSFAVDNSPVSAGAQRNWKPKFFHNYPGPDSDGRERVVDVALRTSAAPTYFPMFQQFVDGGVAANNPSMCALAQALNPGLGGQKVDDVRLLSLGTGLRPVFLTERDVNWGVLEWAPHLVELLMEGSNSLGDYQCRQVLGGNYFRLNPALPEVIGLDDVSRVRQLRDLAASADLTAAIDWLHNTF